MLKYRIFNPSDIVRMGFSIDTAQQVLAEFADICVNDNGKWYGDLALYFAEGWKVFYMISQASAGGWRRIYVRNIIRYHGYRRITDEQESTQSAGYS